MRDVKRRRLRGALAETGTLLALRPIVRQATLKGTPNDYDGHRGRRRRVLLAGCYKLAFWILVYAITYGGLGALRGDNHTHSLYRGAFRLTIAVLIPVAWHMGALAGYF